jgi:hypothetical protein
MALDVELYRRTLYASAEAAGQTPRRLSTFDIHPDGATHTLVLLHGSGSTRCATSARRCA